MHSTAATSTSSRTASGTPSYSSCVSFSVSLSARTAHCLSVDASEVPQQARPTQRGVGVHATTRNQLGSPGNLWMTAQTRLVCISIQEADSDGAYTLLHKTVQVITLSTKPSAFLTPRRTTRQRTSDDLVPSRKEECHAGQHRERARGRRRHAYVRSCAGARPAKCGLARCSRERLWNGSHGPGHRLQAQAAGWGVWSAGSF